jgi:soluble lytic murein transglycosylase-like protein
MRFSQGFAALTALALLLPVQQVHAEGNGSWISPAATTAASAAEQFDPPETGAIVAPGIVTDGDHALLGLVHEYATLSGVPVDLAHAIVTIESRYNAAARNGPHYGLMQINVATARSLGFAGEPSQLLEPATNLRFGMAYLAGAYKLAGGDTCGTIMRYQGGHRATRMSDASIRYCARAKAITAARN